MNSIAKSASAPASATAELSNEITIVFHGRIGCTEFLGTRAQIEAEGIVPAGVEWPGDGFESVMWEAGAVNYLLRRVRPVGAKGPRRAFAQVDHWCLRTMLIYPLAIQRTIEIKEAELRAAIHRASPQGQAEACAAIRAVMAAKGDDRFQTFLSQVPGGAIQRARKSKGAAA